MVSYRPILQANLDLGAFKGHSESYQVVEITCGQKDYWVVIVLRIMIMVIISIYYLNISRILCFNHFPYFYRI